MTPFSVITGEGPALRCAESDQLVIGGGGAAIPVPGDTTENAYAHIENRDGHIWLVPHTPAIPVLLNGTPVTRATPVRDGDSVGIGSSALIFALTDQTLHIRAGGNLAESARQPEPEPRRAQRQAPRSGRLRAFKLILFLVFLMLVLVVLFVFIATPVSIAVNPPPTTLELDGFPPPVPLKNRYLVLPGDYRVRASEAGYVPLDEGVSIARGGFRELKFTLQKLPGRITVYSQPEPAEVRIDGAAVGPTPILQRKVAAGSRTFTVSADRYQPAERVLEVEGLDQEQVIRVELAPDWAPVTFRSEPGGVLVRVDGKAEGLTPLTVELLSGAHVASFELDRYLPAELKLEVTPGMALAAPMVVLTPTPGRLTLDSKPGGATVTSGGVFRGSTPLELTLTPDVEHKIIVVKSGYVAAERSIVLEAAESRSLSIELSAEYGVLFITSSPADAVLYVDSEPKGRASQRLRLTTRKHTLEFRKPGYQTHRVSLVPRAGVSKELSVTLQPLSDNPTASPKPGSVRTGSEQELKLIRPAQFTMGASRREQGRRANESLRRIELTRPYYLGTKEVTNAEFRRYKPEHSSGSAQGRSLDLDDQPVVNVNWGDAAAYLNWLSEQDGLPPAYRKNGDEWEAIRPPGNGYRLPTEAEWAYAARFAGSEARKYAWGESYPPKDGAENFADRSASGLLPYSLSSYDDKYAVTAPVGSFTANQIGLYDIGGNVAEWVNDYYAVYPSETSAAAKDPVGPSSGGHHVIRGAGWKDSTITELRLSFRDYGDKPRPDVGFRIARYAD